MSAGSTGTGPSWRRTEEVVDIFDAVGLEKSNIKRILRKYKYPPDEQDAAVALVLQRAKALGEAWA